MADEEAVGLRAQRYAEEMVADVISTWQAVLYPPVTLQHLEARKRSLYEVHPKAIYEVIQPK